MEITRVPHYFSAPTSLSTHHRALRGGSFVHKFQGQGSHSSKNSKFRGGAYHYPEKFSLPPGPYTQFLENTQSQIVPFMTLSPFQYVPAVVAYYDSTDWVESIMHVLTTTASSDLDPLMLKHASSYNLQDLVL
eukprot:scaffold408897_cov83-Attheya_sp.AAC.1